MPLLIDAPFPQEAFRDQKSLIDYAEEELLEVTQAQGALLQREEFTGLEAHMLAAKSDRGFRK